MNYHRLLWYQISKKILGDRLKKYWATGVHRGNYKAFYWRNSSMAAMASRRTWSASAIAASSSLSSHNTICRLKVHNSASSIFSLVVRSSTSCFELAMRFFSSWISCSVARTLFEVFQLPLQKFKSLGAHRGISLGI
jgi:hypothetical protein